MTAKYITFCITYIICIMWQTLKKYPPDVKNSIWSKFEKNHFYSNCTTKKWNITKKKRKKVKVEWHTNVFRASLKQSRRIQKKNKNIFTKYTVALYWCYLIFIILATPIAQPTNKVFLIIKLHNMLQKKIYFKMFNFRMSYEYKNSNKVI